MPFKQVAVTLLVPPISLLYLALVGLLIGRRYQRPGRVLAWFGALGLLILAMPPVSGGLLVALEQGLPMTPPQGEPPQAIVILGGDVDRDGGPQSMPRPGALSLERELAGALLARRTGLPILVTGGRLRASEPPVAVLMADSLEHDFLVPVRWVEQTSHDTWENAHFSAPVLREQGIDSVYLVTQAWHMRRAVVAFRRAGMKVTPAPTFLDRVPARFATDFVPRAGSWQASYFAFHEWIGWVWYVLR